MRKREDLPFKVKTKYVVERKIDGEKTLFSKRGGEARFEPECEVDTRVASVIDDEDFVIEGYVDDGTFYTSDILFYGGEDLRDEDWPSRYKVLKNEFRWNSAVKMNRPLVVTNREEMSEAVKLFRLLGNSEGIVIRDYDSGYGEDRVFIPDDDGGDF